MAESHLIATDVKVKAQSTPPSPQTYEGWYIGLPSGAPCLASTIPSIKIPRDDQGLPLRMRLIPPDHKHPIGKAWNHIIPIIVGTIDRRKVQLSSVDTVRISRPTKQNASPEELKEADISAPNIIWIGVEPDTLDHDSAHQLVWECKDVLDRNELKDVEVEVRPSSVVLL